MTETTELRKLATELRTAPKPIADLFPVLWAAAENIDRLTDEQAMLVARWKVNEDVQESIIKGLIAERDAALKDAARYQHVKGKAHVMSWYTDGRHSWTMQLRGIEGPTLDEAIDEVIAAATAKEKTT